MRIASRTARRFDAFDKAFDRTIAPILAGAGFAETQPYSFTRAHESGQDIAYFGVEASSMIVQVAFRPPYMDEIDDLYADTLVAKEPVLGACSYLTPVCTTHRLKVYPCRLASQRDRSFAMVAKGLTSHSLTWLKSLRDPVRYADAVAPTTMMFLGRANEIAGRHDRGLAAYEEQWRREQAVWDMSTFRAFVEHESARVYVYLCLKLGRELERCVRVGDAIKYRPHVAAYGEG
jgi:hypothetical protein